MTWHLASTPSEDGLISCGSVPEACAAPRSSSLVARSMASPFDVVYFHILTNVVFELAITCTGMECMSSPFTCIFEL